jgi:fibro-slime domain-containing protein
MALSSSNAGIRGLLLSLGVAGLTGVASLAAMNCGGGSDTSTFPGNGDSGGPDDGGGGGGFGTCDGACQSSIDASPAKAVCGDGKITDKEGCDDGNAKSGDGCNATCTVEKGWVCPTPGLRCEAAKCGDGILAGVEECEVMPGTTDPGCSATCRINPGFDCDPKTFVCAAVVCGDGKVQRGESCEDGNTLPFDGCYNCQKEPACANGVCQATCGDGQRYATEACDDGNTRNGDGCSSTCTVEKGFACTDIMGAPPPQIDLPVLVRDFIGTGNEINGATPHTDYNKLSGGGVLHITETALDKNGRMVLNCPGGDCTQNPGHLYTGGAARPNISTAANFNQWYVNVANVNLPVAITVPLALQSNGTYLWDSANTATNGGKDYFDPIGTGGWVAAGKERQGPSCSPLRNSSFSSETHFIFEYQGGEQFDFSGDDDTWVFVNGKLVIDLGGLHVPLTGSFTLDNAGSASYTSSLEPGGGTVALGLTKGGTYDVVMFQAERNECGSNFKVTIKNFNRPKSQCASTCGDGVVASDEVCDDGKNDGSYGGCMPGCKGRGPYCGDGKVQGTEQCDDGNTDNSDGCTTVCKHSTVN